MYMLSIFVDESLNRDESGSLSACQGKEYKERKDKDPNIEPGSKRGEVRKERGCRIQNPSSVSLTEVKIMSINTTTFFKEIE